MSGENQTVVVNPPKNGEASKSDSGTPVAEAIDQAKEFGAMREAFHLTQREVDSIRSELENSRGDRTMLMERLERMEAQQARLLAALESEQVEEKEEIEAPTLPEGTTVIVPPKIEEPQKETEGEKPKAKQSRLSLILFGREE